MADDTITQEDKPVEVFLTVDLDGNYWWAMRDKDGELTQSDGPYQNQGAAEEAAKAALTPEPPGPPEIHFSVEEDQRVAEAPNAESR